MVWLPISTIGEAGATVKVREFDVVPPGASTFTDALPLPTIALPGTDAVSCVKLAKTVVSGEPFQ
jgi:hypothetical protein